MSLSRRKQTQPAKCSTYLTDMSTCSHDPRSGHRYDNSINCTDVMTSPYVVDMDCCCGQDAICGQAANGSRVCEQAGVMAAQDYNCCNQQECIDERCDSPNPVIYDCDCLCDRVREVFCKCSVDKERLTMIVHKNDSSVTVRLAEGAEKSTITDHCTLQGDHSCCDSPTISACEKQQPVSVAEDTGQVLPRPISGCSVARCPSEADSKATGCCQGPAQRTTSPGAMDSISETGSEKSTYIDPCLSVSAKMLPYNRALPCTIPNVILVPVAYSSNDGPSVALLGHPQVVIPIAIPRDAKFDAKPLLLDPTLAAATQLVIPAVTLRIQTSEAPMCASGARSEIPNPNRHHRREPSDRRHLLNDGDTSSDARSSLSSKGGSRDPGYASVIKRSISTQPLDLTLRRKKRSQSVSLVNEASPNGSKRHCREYASADIQSQPNAKVSPTQTVKEQPSPSKSALTPPDLKRPTSPRLLGTRSICMPAGVLSSSTKAFTCAHCGIRFSSAKTLEGHQKFYCKSNIRVPSDDPQVMAAMQVQELCCQFCDYSAATTSQLIQHAKTAHALTQSYMCNICGYKGYSVRGMKSHLKLSHQDLPIPTSSAVSPIGRPTSIPIRDSNRTPPAAPLGADAQIDVNSRAIKLEISSEILPSEASCSVTESGAPELGNEPENIDPSDGVTLSVVDGVDTEDHDNGRGLAKDTLLEPVEDVLRGIGGPGFLNEEDTGGLSGFGTIITSTGVSKFACQYCSYASAHKGNVKRHLNLVHKGLTVKTEPFVLVTSV